jgi:uncharacterized protein YijF (DUF1287 family)
MNTINDLIHTGGVSLISGALSFVATILATRKRETIDVQKTVNDSFQSLAHAYKETIDGLRADVEFMRKRIFNLETFIRSHGLDIPLFGSSEQQIDLANANKVADANKS